jgi:hypothetical protein
VLSSEIPELDKQGLRKFGLIFFVFFTVLFLLLLPTHFLWIPMGFTFGVLAVALLNPERVVYIYRPWMRFGNFMGGVMSIVIVSAVFFAIVTPIGLVMGLLGKRALAKGADPNVTTYRCSPESIEKSFETPF